MPKKNIRLLGGKPLLAWSVEVAKAVPDVTDVIVSTDDEGIAKVARACGAEVLVRPATLATDAALVIDTVRDVLQRLEAENRAVDIVVLLEPTCPFRSPEDVRACLELLSERGYDSVATFTEARLNPHRAWKLSNGRPETFIKGAIPWLPRQKLPEAFQLSGAVYAFFAKRLPPTGISFLFGESGGFVMPEVRSFDIDTEYDFDVAELLISRRDSAA